MLTLQLSVKEGVRESQKDKERREGGFLNHVIVKTANIWGVRNERLRLLPCAWCRKRGFDQETPGSMRNATSVECSHTHTEICIIFTYGVFTAWKGFFLFVCFLNRQMPVLNQPWCTSVYCVTFGWQLWATGPQLTPHSALSQCTVCSIPMLDYHITPHLTCV